MSKMLFFHRILFDNSFFCAYIQKIRYQHIWPNLQREIVSSDVLAAALVPAITLTALATKSEYECILLPTFR